MATRKTVSDAQIIHQLAQAVRQMPDLYAMDTSTGAALSTLRKALLEVDSTSNQGTEQGIKTHLFNLEAVRDFQDFNPHHAACIEAKRATTVGLGFKSERVLEVLNPICDFSLSDVLLNFAQDYWETGNGYLEVVRGATDKTIITGLHHIPAADVFVFVEDKLDPSKRHFQILGGEGGIVDRRFARFGDRDDYIKRNEISGDEADAVSEVIHWRMPTSRSRWYGYPEYFSAVPSIELVQAMTQHEFNYFFNNGVPEFLLFLIGKKLDKKTWNSIVSMLQANQGHKNTRRSQAVNLVGTKEEIQVQVEKLGQATDSATSPYAVHSEVTAASIVTAHGVPPILAGIQIPGKLGATNEGPNALMLFQTLKIGPAQRALSQLLASTLGDEGLKFRTKDGGTDTLTADDFLGSAADEKAQANQDAQDAKTGMVTPVPKKAPAGNGFFTVLDEVNLGAMDTMSKMREPVVGSGRDLNAGTLSSADGRSKTGGKPAKGTGKSQAAGRGKPKGKPKGPIGFRGAG